MTTLVLSERMPAEGMALLEARRDAQLVVLPDREQATLAAALAALAAAFASFSANFCAAKAAFSAAAAAFAAAFAAFCASSSFFEGSGGSPFATSSAFFFAF